MHAVLHVSRAGAWYTAIVAAMPTRHRVARIERDCHLAVVSSWNALLRRVPFEFRLEEFSFFPGRSCLHSPDHVFLDGRGIA